MDASRAGRRDAHAAPCALKDAGERPYPRPAAAAAALTPGGVGTYTRKRSGVHRVLRWRLTPNPTNLIRLVPAEEELNLSLLSCPCGLDRSLGHFPEQP
jgi:hypothetical protein